MTWNAQHGGGPRAQAFAQRAASFCPDVLVVTEFRNSKTGAIIRSVLEQSGLTFQSQNNNPPRLNSVLIAARVPFKQEDVPGLGDESHRGVLTRFDGFDLLGFYFPGRKKKIPIFEAICELDLSRLSSACLLMGDLNTGRHFIDENAARFTAADYFDKLEELGWIDIWRSRHPEKREFTWFSNIGNGFRIDHAFGTRSFDELVTEAHYSHDVREERLSDHSAMIIDTSL